jgi:DNA-binding XRE family transcriptional regulator
MATKEMNRPTLPGRTNVRMHEAVTLALGLLIERIQSLSDEDREDLSGLMKELPRAESDEDLNALVVAMREILAQEPVRVLPFDLSDVRPGPGLKKWMDQVGGKIKACRKKARLSQEELAAKTGLPQSHISRLENGQHSPSHATLQKLAKALRIRVEDLDALA